MPDSLLDKRPDPAVNKVLSFLNLPANFFAGSKSEPYIPPTLSFNTTEVEWKVITQRLRMFYEPYVDDLYELMDELDQKEFELAGWPRGKKGN